MAYFLHKINCRIPALLTMGILELNNLSIIIKYLEKILLAHGIPIFSMIENNRHIILMGVW